MTTLLRHDQAVFDDQTVYATGNAYLGCEFRRCTIILKGVPFLFDTCIFDSCVWDLSLVIHCREQAAALSSFFSTTIMQSLPMTPETPPVSVGGEGERNS